MRTISEGEFNRIVGGLVSDADAIVRHNPIGTREEILCWMLMSCLVSYLSLTEMETPCFSGRADQETYREAIRFILKDRRIADFEVEPYLDKLSRA